MRYEGAIYRPPSEAYSLIVQATVGCSHNKCTFCSMYREKKFKIRDVEDILEDISVAAAYDNRWERVFLADGDALVIPTEKLVRIMEHVSAVLPKCKRIGIYASVQSIGTKSVEELALLKRKGLGIAYLGVESGNDRILGKIRKGVDSKAMKEAALKVKAAGIPLSIMLISGIGGKSLTREHAIESAHLMEAINPEYLSLLTLMVEPETVLAEEIKQGQFQLLSSTEVLEETLLFLDHLGRTTGTFRSNHASNYLNLAGELPRDRVKLMEAVKHTMESSGRVKEEYFRRL